MANGLLIAFGVFVIVFVAFLVGYAGWLFARGHRISKEREQARRRSFDAAMKKLEDSPAAPGRIIPARHVAEAAVVEDRGPDMVDALVTAVIAEEIIGGLEHHEHYEPVHDVADSSGWSAPDQGSTSVPDPAPSFDPGPSFGGDGGSF